MGHAGLARVVDLLKNGKKLDKAVQTVRASSVFTTHTPVPAGHDRFTPALTRKYLKPLIKGSGLKMHDVMELGSERPGDKKAPMCMTALALRLSERANGVAKLHGEVSRQMWQFLFDVKKTKDVPIGYVTNGALIAAAALPLLGILGALSARAGGATLLPAILRLTIWGATAMAATAGIGRLVGVGL